MSDKLVTLATYPTAVEAGFIRSFLEAEGIRAYVADESSVTMLSGLGNSMGWVKLHVAESDAERAEEMLAEHHRDAGAIDEGALSAEAMEAVPNPESPLHEISTCLCPECGRESLKRDASCEYCGASLETAEPLLTLVEPGRADADQTANSDIDDETVDPVDEMASRAVRAAGIGLICFPVMLYAAWLVARLIISSDELSDYASKRLWLAFALTGVGFTILYALIRIELAR